MMPQSRSAVRGRGKIEKEVDQFEARSRYVGSMSTFAIAAVFEALVVQPSPVEAVVIVEPPGVVGAEHSTEHFCAFTSDVIRSADEEHPRDSSQQRHPAFVSWLRRETGAVGDIHRAA